MLAEALVVFACVKSAGCNETSSHYYSTHPEFRQIVEKNERKVKEIVGPAFLKLYGPIIFAAAGGTGTVRLTKHFSLQMNKEKSILAYQVEF